MRKQNLLHWAMGGLMAAGIAATLGTGAARADLKTTYQAGPIVYPGADPAFPQQGAVNKNIGSPYYGYFYIADYGGGNSTAPQPQYGGVSQMDQKQIHIWKPVDAGNGTGATAYEDTGLKILMSGTGQFDPFAVAVGADDTVWIGNPTSGTIDAAPPVPTSPATSVTATTQITGAGFVRGLYVRGPISDVTIAVAGSAFVEKYTGSAPNITTPGTFTRVYNKAISGLNSGPYGPAMDLDGNLYVVTKGSSAGQAAFIKVDNTGAIVPFNALIPPDFPATSDLASVGFVEDHTYKGGGYLYSINRTVAAPLADSTLRYDLDGNYLDGYGPAQTTNPANYTVLSIPRSGTYGDTDDLGNVYHKTTTGNGAYQKILKLAPFVVDNTVDTPLPTSAGGAVKSSPVAVNGVVYFGSDDGKLYAYNTATGNLVSGFPKDVTAAVGAPVKLQGRPAVYTINDVTKVYFTTDRGDLGFVNADGSDLTVVANPIPMTDNTGTPAVTADGTIYVGGSTLLGAGVLKINPDLTLDAFQTLGGSSTTVSSVAVNGNNVYVGLNGGTDGDIVVLKASDLTPQAAGVATGEGVTAPPFVDGISAYVGTLAGNFYKVNSITFAPDPTFGLLNTPATPGHAAIGEPLPGSAFNDGAIFYVGSSKGKVFQINSLDGSFNVLYDTGNANAVIPGVVVNRATSTLAFGTDVPGAAEADPHSGIFYQVPTNVTSGPVNAQVFRGYGAFNTTPSVNKTTDSSVTPPVTSYRFFIGSDDSNVYAFSNR